MTMTGRVGATSGFDALVVLAALFIVLFSGRCGGGVAGTKKLVGGSERRGAGEGVREGEADGVTRLTKCGCVGGGAGMELRLARMRSRLAMMLSWYMLMFGRKWWGGMSVVDWLVDWLCWLARGSDNGSWEGGGSRNGALMERRRGCVL